MLEKNVEIHQFLGKIVDSGQLEGLTESTREGMISDLAELLEEKVFAFFVSELGDEEQAPFMETVRADDAEGLMTLLKSSITDFDNQFKKLIESFWNEYAVTEEL